MGNAAGRCSAASTASSPTRSGAAEAQVAELNAFADQLRTAAVQLSGDPVDGPCGPDCACVTRATGDDIESTTVNMGRKPPTVPEDVPIACTLEPDALPDRLAEWQHVLTAATGRDAIDGGLRIEFRPDADTAELGRLIGAEQRCCGFFRFTLMIDASGIALEVRAPELAAGCQPTCSERRDRPERSSSSVPTRPLSIRHLGGIRLWAGIVSDSETDPAQIAVSGVRGVDAPAHH